MSQGTSCPEVDTRLNARVDYHADIAPDYLWRRFAPVVAARRSMRLHDPVARKFVAAGPLTIKRPVVPAAVPLFSRGRARLLALDFDAKTHGGDEVTADVARVLSWLDECGGRAVVDVSTSGGRHVLIPLAPGTTAGIDELKPLLRQLAARLRTLDITPMTNPATGCITVPGSACREGGHRRLVDTDVANALDTLTIGSDPGTLPRLSALLGGIHPRRTDTRTVAAVIDATSKAERIVGTGDHARLHPRLCRTTPPPTSVNAFAATGTRDPRRWPSRSEARQSVLTHAVLTGDTAADILARADTAAWAGIRAAYARYADPATAMRRDAAAALDWAATNLPESVRDTGHKQKHTGGTSNPIFRTWTSAAQNWVTHEYRGRRDRWTTHAVIQALGWAAAVSGQITEGTPVVGVGGRSLSIAAGMLPESTVWSVLERLRDTEGSPVLLIERGVGQNPDRYALVPATGYNTTTGEEMTPTRATAEDEHREIDSVHPAWSVLGWRHRILYEAVVATAEAMTAEELFDTVAIGRTSGYDTLLDLRIAGLLTVTGQHIALGTTELDDIGHRHGLGAAIRARIVRHRAERIVWREWLAAREEARIPAEPSSAPPGVVEDAAAEPDEHYFAAVISSGPPERAD